MTRRINELSDAEVLSIREYIDANFVRGQRTHTNARTRKGPAKAIAGKKK